MSDKYLSAIEFQESSAHWAELQTLPSRLSKGQVVLSDSGSSTEFRFIKIRSVNKESAESQRLAMANVLSGLSLSKKLLDEMVAANPVLQKIRNDQPVTRQELTQLCATILTQSPNVDLDVLNEFYGRDFEGLQHSPRELVGLNPAEVEQHFTQFLHNHPSLTAKQTRFINLLKNYLAEHAVIEIANLYDAPFTSV